MDSVFLRVALLACLGFLLSIGLGFFIGYKWHEKRTIEDDSDSDYSESEEEDEEESEEEDEDPGDMCWRRLSLRFQSQNGSVCSKRYSNDKRKGLCAMLSCCSWSSRTC